ncbi:unnamed protein product [Gongylonema pulchrum]|uniref:Uncharacterized protein n=1 Tax=Gongylonema pulchrum TaxID=637853 RepID=A0A183CUT6_9BILA|nr:unnamed protein product [Gongylonema pulchrum]
MGGGKDQQRGSTAAGSIVTGNNTGRRQQPIHPYPNLYFCNLMTYNVYYFATCSRLTLALCSFVLEYKDDTSRRTELKKSKESTDRTRQNEVKKVPKSCIR